MQVSRLESFLFNSLSCVYHIMSLLSPFLFVFGLFCFIKFWISDLIWILLKNTTGNFHDHRYKRTHDDNDDYDPNNNNDVCFEILFTQRWIYSNIVEWETKKRRKFVQSRINYVVVSYTEKKQHVCLWVWMDRRFHRTRFPIVTDCILYKFCCLVVYVAICHLINR